MEKLRLGVKNKVDLKKEGKNWKSKATKDKVSNGRKSMTTWQNKKGFKKEGGD